MSTDGIVLIVPRLLLYLFDKSLKALVFCLILFNIFFLNMEIKMLDDSRPLPVSLIIVVRNERAYIEKSLNSLLNQTYPNALKEIILVDGFSEDGTREWLQEIIEVLQAGNVNIKLLDNPKRILASGWNIGIKYAKGDIVCRIDAHSEISPDYIEKGVKELLEKKNANVVCVGGILENIGFGFIGKSIADLFSSKFTVGNSPFRTKASKIKYTDTAVFGLYWRWIFNDVGYFDEDLERNQDIVLHAKILERGYRFITRPDMRAKYHVRSNIPALIKKAFKDGYWIIASEKSYLRHRVPLYFVFYVVTIPFFRQFIKIFLQYSPLSYYYLLPLMSYILLSIYFSIKDGKALGRVILPFLFPIFHISYGIGSMRGMIDKVIKNRLFIKNKRHKYMRQRDMDEPKFENVRKVKETKDCDVNAKR